MKAILAGGSEWSKQGCRPGSERASRAQRARGAQPVKVEGGRGGRVVEGGRQCTRVLEGWRVREGRVRRAKGVCCDRKERRSWTWLEETIACNG